MAFTVLEAGQDRPPPGAPADLSARGQMWVEGELRRIRVEPADARELARITASHVGDPLAVSVDDVWLASPTVREPITGGELVITLAP